MSRITRVLPGCIITAGAVLRLWHLQTSPVWYDESFTLLVARLPLGQLLQATAGDVHPPFHYLLIGALLRLLPAIPGAVVMRLSSVALGVLALVLFWRLSALLELAWGARIAALAFLAFLPTEIFYAMDGRMYPLLQVLILLQVWSIYRRHWALLWLFTVLALYTHNYALIYSAVLGAAGLLHLYREERYSPDLLRLAGAMGGAALCFLPWVFILAGQMAAVGVSYWIQPVTAGSVAVALSAIFTGFINPPNWIIGLQLTLGAVLLLLLYSGLQHRRYTELLWLFAPVALAALLSILWKPILLYRGFYPSLPALALLGGESFSGARAGAPRLGRWLLLIPWGVCLVFQIGAAQAGQLKGWAIWPEPVPGPVVVHMEDTSYIVLRQAWPEAHHYLLEAGCPPEPGALTQETRSALRYEIIRPEQLSSLGSYALAASLGPLATKCHEEQFWSLTKGQRVSFLKTSRFGQYGVWIHGK